MPGKQVGLSEECWPDRLIGDLPNFYVYAANNPSEGALAKRRTAATLLSHLTPPVGRAGLYKGLLELKGTLDRYRGLDPAEEEDRGAELLESIRAQAEAVDLVPEDAGPWEDPEAAVQELRRDLLELEYALVPHGLHVMGEAPAEEERAELLLASAECGRPDAEVPAMTEVFADGGDPGDDADGAGSWAGGPEPTEEQRARMEAATAALAREGRVDPALEALGVDGVDREAGRRLLESLAGLDARLRENRELEAVLDALEGGFVSPAPGGDVLRNPDVLPTGRNLYGFDPYRVPGPFAVRAGREQAERILARRREETGRLPESVAMVLWGTDNLKTDGEPVAQALALMGAEPRFDSYGRLAGARLVPLEELGRPRVDVVLTTSGIFRDLLPLQMKLLAEAAWLAASADEPPERNFVRKRSLAHADALGCDLETAALRVFSNADGAYGANVNHMVEGGTWEEEGELAETFLRRKGTAYDRRARAAPAGAVMRSALGGVECTYQNLESVELGVSDLDQYFDSLGGMTKAAEELRGERVSAYVGDTSRSRGRVRSLPEQIDLEARTRLLNPRWYESMLEHGHEGVREIESRVTNTVGWSATTGEVSGWVYDRVADTYVLDEEMRRRLAELNPAGAARMADRLLEASDRGYWSPDPETLDAVRDATHELEDRMEGITVDEPDPGEVAA
jgi:magnesium chelatase subunit H